MSRGAFQKHLEKNLPKHFECYCNNCIIFGIEDVERLISEYIKFTPQPLTGKCW